MRSEVNLSQHAIPRGEKAVLNIMTDNTGTTFGGGFPGVLGEASTEVAISGPADTNVEFASAGIPGFENDSSGLHPLEMLTQNSLGLFPNPEFGGEPGRIDRLAYDPTGPAHVGSVESFRMDGERIKPGRPDIARGGPVGASGDLGQFYAVALAESTYGFPAQDISQLKIALGIG